MTQAQIIEAVLQAPPDRLDAIMQAARGTTEKPRPGTIRQSRFCGGNGSMKSRVLEAVLNRVVGKYGFGQNQTESRHK